MQEEIKEVIEEGKEYIRLKRAYENARFPDSGTPAYIVSVEWLNKYKEFVFYNDLKYNNGPNPDEDHIVKKHPGKIINAGLLHQEE